MGLPFDTLVVDGFPANKVNDTFQLILHTNGNLNCGGRHAKLCPNLIDHPPRIRARSANKNGENAQMSDHATGVPIHFVNERQSWDVVPPHLPVDSYGLTLQTIRLSQHIRVQ